LSGAAQGLYYDEENSILWVGFPDQGTAGTVQVEK
jgi:hypothetical protein